ncbi:MAG: L,D-transpeptidase [Chloroflexi bacterium]|nr:L,D-transpeptidase [Chloroflexota bacterium]
MFRYLTLLIIAASIVLPRVTATGGPAPAAAAPPAADDDPRPCSLLTPDLPRSDECDAEIAANPLPEFERPIEYDAVRDGEATPRSILMPEEPLPYPIAQQRRAWYFSDVPGVLPADDDWTAARRVAREEMSYVYHTVDVNGVIWHLIGPGMWMEDQYTSVLVVPNRPDEVRGRWVAIDLNQQTLIAFEDDTPILASLVSTGYFLQTTPGLFHVYARTEGMVMRGPPGANPPEYEFYTRWVMFFNADQGLHAMPYHNYFGIARTHGCINVPPGDEEWLWNFFAENEDEWHPSFPDTFQVDDIDAAPWVYIYESDSIPAAWSY